MNGSRVVVAEASDEVEASIWVSALQDAGIEAAAVERGVGAALGGAAMPGTAKFPVLVDEGRIGDARNVIAGLGGAAALAPLYDRAAARANSRRALLLVAGIAGGIVALGIIARLMQG